MTRSSRLFIFSLALAALVAGLVFPGQTPAQQGPASVVVTPVIERELAAGQTFVGTVRPLRASTIGSAVDGRVELFNVNEGDRVTKGTEMAKLRSGTLELERDAALSLLDVRWEELLEMVNGSRPEEIDEARAGVAAAQARLEYARARRTRAQELYRRGQSIPIEELQEAVSAAVQAEELHRQAQAKMTLMEKGPREEKVNQAFASFTYQLDVVLRLEDQIFLHTVRAPFDGYITTEHCEVGRWLLKGHPVVDLVQLDIVEVEAAVSEEAVASLRLGGTARVDSSALRDQTFTGKITRIVPEADPRTRTFPVKVQIENPSVDGIPVLKSNMFVQVTLPVGPKGKGLLVPKDAIVLGGLSPIVYVVDPDSGDPKKGKARPVPVQLGVAEGGLIQIKGEIRPGQNVVIRGNERIRPGQDLIVLRSE